MLHAGIHIDVKRDKLKEMFENHEQSQLKIPLNFTG